MVISRSHQRSADSAGRHWRRVASITAELCVAIGLVAATLLPLSLAFMHEQRLARTYYWRALAIEVVDGEMETLMAGEWQAFKPGRQLYEARSEAAKNLPAGEFALTLGEDTVRLEWLPKTRHSGGRVIREARRK